VVLAFVFPPLFQRGFWRAHTPPSMAHLHVTPPLSLSCRVRLGFVGEIGVDWYPLWNQTVHKRRGRGIVPFIRTLQLSMWSKRSSFPPHAFPPKGFILPRFWPRLFRTINSVFRLSHAVTDTGTKEQFLVVRGGNSLRIHRIKGIQECAGRERRCEAARKIIFPTGCSPLGHFERHSSI